MAAVVTESVAGGTAERHSPSPHVTQLPSGLRVVTERVPTALSVAAGVWVGVGARDEPDELSGVSHFLEHLLFKGTEERSARAIAAAVDRVGGDMNAFTAKEYTAYYCRVPAVELPLALELLGDVLTAPALRDGDVDNERQVILEELAMDDDLPEDVVHRLLAEAMFPGHALGRETAGTMATVETITPDDVRALLPPVVPAVLDGGGRRRRLSTTTRSSPRSNGGSRRPGRSILPRGTRPSASRRHWWSTGAAPSRSSSPSASVVFPAATPTARRSTSSTTCWAAACRAGCSRRSASSGGWPTPSAPARRRTPTPAHSSSRRAPRRPRSARC